jgi:hypothetical protein
MSKIYVDEILPKENAQISAPNLQLPAGSVVQVVQSVVDTVASFNASSQGAVTADIITATITPKYVTSKILITGQINGSADSKGHAWWIILKRDGSSIGDGANPGSRRACHSGFAQYLNNYAENLGHGTVNYLDSPASVSQITYSVGLGHNSGGGQTFNLNRSQVDNDNNDRPRSVTTLTLTEIAG